jgi:hypothetical protein
MFGRKILTKKEQKHLRENKIRTLYDMRKQVAFLKDMKEKYPDYQYPCYDCLHIAKKLGMWEEKVGVITTTEKSV